MVTGAVEDYVRVVLGFVDAGGSAGFLLWSLIGRVEGFLEDYFTRVIQNLHYYILSV